MFGRRTKRGGLALLAQQDTSWLEESRLRQLFDADLESGERILRLAEVTAASASFDRPVTGWAVATDRAIRIRWGFGTAVRQSLQVGYDRVRFVDVPVAEPHTAQVTYFDAARTTAGWYQDLWLRAESAELTQALPHLLAAYHRRLAERAEAAAPSADTAAVQSVPARRDPLPALESAAPVSKDRMAAGTHKGRRRGLARR